MMESLWLNLIIHLLGVVGFFIAWLTTRKLRAGYKVGRFFVFSKDENKRVIHKSPHFNWLIGVCYSTLAYLSLPIFLWRYGLRLTLIAFFIPVVLIYVIPMGYNYMASENYKLAGDSSMLLKMLVIGPILNGYWGVYLAFKDSTYVQDKLSANGWIHLGEIEAPSRKLAIRAAKAMGASPTIGGAPLKVDGY